MTVLWTYGTGSGWPADLWAACDRNRIRAVVDVRREAISRKPGWGGDDLCANARYEHRPELGNARHAKTAWEPVDPEAAARVLEALALRIIGGETMLLLCAEADPHYCHRAEIARRLSAKTGCEVRHLR